MPNDSWEAGYARGKEYGRVTERKRITKELENAFRLGDADIYNKIYYIVNPCEHLHIKVDVDLFGTVVQSCMDCGYNVRV